MFSKKIENPLEVRLVKHDVEQTVAEPASWQWPNHPGSQDDPHRAGIFLILAAHQAVFHSGEMANS